MKLIDDELGIIPNYRTNESEETQTISPQEDEREIVNVKPAIEEEEPTGEKVARVGGSLIPRALEAFGGKYGDILDLARHGIVSGFEKLTGKEQPGFRKLVEREVPGVHPPSSEQLRGLTKEFTGEKFEPRSEEEQSLQDIASSFGSLFNPAKGAKGWLVPIGQAVTGEAAKEGIKKLEGSGFQQEASKMAAMFLIDVASRGNAKKFAQGLYKEAQAVQPNAVIDFSNNLRALDAQAVRLGKGLSTPNKAQILKPLEELRAKASSGQIPLEELIEARRNINEIRRQPALRELSNQDKNLVRAGLNEIDGTINDAIDKYGKKQAPGWLKKYREANTAFRGLRASEAVADFVKENAKNPLLAGPAGVLFGLGSAFPLGTAGAIGASLATAQTANLLHRVATNRPLLKHYTQVISAAAANDAAAMNKAMKELNDGIKESLKREEKRQPQKRGFTPIISA